MRIISGKYKGRVLLGQNIDGTRPTMDRVKESMFGTIQSYIKDSVCLDLFAGSGALGLEAISNGAKEVHLVDHNKIAINTIKNNVENLKVSEKYYLYNMDYNKALDFFMENKIKFDLIFLDPPYDYQLITKIINKININNLLSEDGIIICEYEKDELVNLPYKLIKDKKIGNKKLSYFKNC